MNDTVSDGPSHTFLKQWCKAITFVKKRLKRALKPKCQQTTVKARTIDGVTNTIIYTAPPSDTPERDPSIRWHVNKKRAFRHGSDCAHFVSWYCSSLSQICTISQLGFFAFQRVHSSAQQREQRFRVRSLELRHGVSCVSIVWTPSRSTHCSAHELFNDWHFQSGLPVILR